MADDDDLGATLPDPPPPAPARRDAAIGEAMRRFDGEPASSAQPGTRPGTGWIRRPQIGALVTLGLVALIGLPAAWMVADRQNEAYQQALRTAYDVAPAPRRVAEDALKVPAAPRPMAPPPPVVPPREIAKSLPVAVPPTVAAPVAPSPPLPAPPAPAELAQSDASAPEAAKPMAKSYRTEQRFAAIAPPPPPPPPPPAMVATPAPVAAPPAPLGEVVVTGARRASPRAGRGDWNACTLDDPSRNLAFCRHVLDPAAPGPKGVAAAHIADGLTEAWQGDTDGAIAAFDQAIAIAPRLPTAYVNRSQAYARNGDDDRALADADAAVRYAPGSAQAHYNRSVLLRRRGEIAKAQADEQRAVDVDPSYEAVIPQ